MIQVLSSEIINQIAAGEVVERPSHLVKELVENSLDAGSDEISIEISEGGRSIRVLDNGNGIVSHDLEKALQRHATSKITKTDDLWNLHTFGFRGEALASAAAVSTMTLKSYEKNEKKSSQIESKFGVLSAIKPSSGTQGTEIKIEDLFENVPARLKFLKSETSETTQIKTVIKALALAQPQVEFRLISNGDLLLYYPKRTDQRTQKIDRVRDVLEKKELFEAQGNNAGFKCHLVFSSPHEVAKTSRQIWIFVQNRWVQDRAIQTAVMDAYRSLLMHGEYPYVVVYLDCKPDEIDVNIHPTKSQIKFQDASTAFKTVHTTLRHALEKAPWLGDYQSAGPIQTTQSLAQNLKLFDQSISPTQFKSKDFNFSQPDISIQNIADLKVRPADVAKPLVESYWSSLQVIGQINLTYIVCQKEDRMVFVDQHAAHERVVYESLMQAWKAGNFEVQSFLFPLAIDLSEDKVEILLNHNAEIQKLGFEIDQLGPSTIGIKSAPALVKDSSLPVVFEKMALDLLNNGGSFAIEKKISDIFATMACHSVVRAGQSLSISEMHELLKSMDQYSLSSFCPHGRPVSVETQFTELEKLFGRIN
ncbi:MAG: DNA mismatch repair endonuclease MutL [Bdellovibrionota bacterium]